MIKDPVTVLRNEAHPLTREISSWDPLIEKVGDCQVVLLGEASHGTHEFYRERAIITSRLIQEKGFRAIAVEADWPDARRAHQYATGQSDDANAEAALGGFKRFPAWMWRNKVMADFLDWMHRFNAGLAGPAQRVGFYGIDLYSLHASIEAVLSYLENVDAAAAAEARERYACFDHFGGDPQRYGFQAAQDQEQTCEESVVAQLIDLRNHAREFLERDGEMASEEFFSAEQNARLIANAEEYYRSMFLGRHTTWNIRDTHMAETVQELIEHRENLGLDSKLIIWAHNSHIGDARATELTELGEINLGQLLRESFGKEAALIGFSTYAGSVTAASDWGSPAERKTVRPALPDSCEELFHRTSIPSFLLNLRERSSELDAALGASRLQRAIGVIYRPETERTSHYFHAALTEQFDYVIHFDHTEAVEPLDRDVYWVQDELPETYPFSL